MSTSRNLSYLADFISSGGVLSQQNTLPTQTGNTGKYLITDGTIASWASVDALPTQTGNSGKYLTTNGTSASWSTVSGGGGVDYLDGGNPSSIYGGITAIDGGTP
jgi:hypothetical protein